ncbi:MAG: 16S rRNA (cytidine(1402)-2'-O)-methyltransferase [Kiritimatiellae bacterium]|nr:16S rRNA (cytidine(1402)-2'-O)-methyltransferase [Kiritimatiellia bacterium]MCO5068710.1 16S rRNA (cytidine(1402)-2'-O)-methyltransferase [Kiritimatiellia bacterium]
MTPGLYIVGTPIGHLQDITLRALETLRDVSLILAEDTRQTRKLLERHGLHTPMRSYHKFNEAARAEEIVARLRAGEAIALVSDSGMPAVSDPGARLVATCREAGLPIAIVPGPSAVTSAIALAGMPARGFVFAGFLPHKSGARKRELADWGRQTLPVVFFESPYRLLKLLDEVEAVLGPRELFVGRELTKHFEEHLRGTPAEIRASFAKRPVKGECVVVLAPAAKGSGDLPDEEDEPTEA